MNEADQMPQSMLNRRAFIRRGSLLVAGSTLAACDAAVLAEGADKPTVRVGLVTDLHYADRNPAGTRHYRESLAKSAEAAKRFEQERVDFVVALGDMIDSAESLDAEKEHLRRIVKHFTATPGKYHFVLGNHCVSALTKPEFLDIVGQKQSFYSFDLKDVHFAILDACFRSDGAAYGRKNFEWTDSNIPAAEIEWLRADLSRTANKTIVFVHQRLDIEPPLGVKNAPDLRKLLEESGKVLAVVQGHDHKGDCQRINGILYCTLQAMVEGTGEENNAYAVLDVLPQGAVRITGFRRQKSHAK